MSKSLSWFKAVFLFLTILLIVNQLFGLVMYWLNIPINRESYMVFIGGYFLIFCLCIRKVTVERLILNREDWVSMLLVLVTMGTIVRPLWEFNKSLRLPIISEGVDIAAHYNMFSAMLDNNSLNYGKGNFDNYKPWSGWTEYPPGFYENAAIFYSIALRPDSVLYADEVMRTSYMSLFSIAIYCLLIYWFSVLVLETYKSLKKKLTLMRAIVMVSLIMLASEMVLYKIYSFGFMAQLLALIFLIFGWWVVNNRQLIRGWFSWFLLLLVNFAIANTWYFLSPIVLLVLIYETVRNKYYKNWWFYAVNVILMFPTLYPVYMSVRSYSISNEISAGGGVFVINGIVLMAMLLILSNYKKLARNFILLSAVLFSLVIGFYQAVSNGSTGYYYSKSLYTVFIFLTAELIVLLCGKLVTNKIKIGIDKAIFLSMTVLVIYISLKSLPGEGMSLFSKREYFLDREKYDGLMVLNETKKSESYYLVPFGDFKDTLWFYSYLGFLPDFYSEMWPRIDFKSYPWIFEKMKDIKSEKPIMIFDAYTVKKLFEPKQKEYILENKIKVYPENVEIY